MYFWRIERLKAEMAARPFSDREMLPYVIVTAALFTGLVYVPFEKNVWDFIGGGWSVLLVVLGSLYIFRKNGGAAGEQFLQRYVAIGWVVTLRFLVLVLALTIVLSVTGVFGEHTTWGEAVFFAVVEVLLWWRIGYHTGDVAEKTARREP